MAVAIGCCGVEHGAARHVEHDELAAVALPQNGRS
jgi:hypothetical protein